MDYEIVMLEEIRVAGLSAMTCSASPDAGAVIGGLWEKFYSGGVCDAIKGKKGESAFGIYTNYSSKGDCVEYTAIVGYAAEGEQEGGDVITSVIPAGRYAKFNLKGKVIEAVSEFWQAAWQSDLPRSFLYDFEEYKSADMENGELDIYISLK